jgi:hypothetical protein
MVIHSEKSKVLHLHMFTGATKLVSLEDDTSTSQSLGYSSDKEFISISFCPVG